jgi:hypothetical protein
MHMKEKTTFSAPIFLALLSLLLGSCADFELPPDQPNSNHPNIPGEGDTLRPPQASANFSTLIAKLSS